MSTPPQLSATLQSFETGNGRPGKFYSLPALEKTGVGPISRLPVSIRLVLESVLRNCDGKKVTEHNVRALANWQPNAERHGGNPVHCGAHRVAGFHRRAIAGGFGGHAFRRGAAGQESENHRAAGAGGFGGGPLGAGGRERLAGCLRAQPRNRIPAQPRALSISQMGHAGLRHLQGRAARHRHRPSGQSGIPRQRRACLHPQLSTLNPQLFTIPTRWSARIRTRP